MRTLFMFDFDSLFTLRKKGVTEQQSNTFLYSITEFFLIGYYLNMADKYLADYLILKQKACQIMSNYN
jgi:hypothetical protein